MKKQRLMIESIRYITGNQKSLKIQGPTTYVDAYQTALKASRNLYKVLCLENAKLADIEEKVRKKNKAAKAFRDITGSPWPF